MLHSGRHHAGRARWSILGMPDAWVIAPTPPHEPANPVTLLDEALAGTRLDAGARSTAHDSLPFVGGWIGVLGYELGRVMEPSASRGPDPRQRTDGTAWPLIEFARCGGALLFDAADQTWRIVGRAAAVDRLADIAGAIGSSIGRRVNGEHNGAGASPRPSPAPAPHWRLEALRAIPEDDDFRRVVRETVELIRAGDIFQANIARFLHGRITGDRRAFAMAALRGARPWYGALLELNDGRSIVSLSPELFLEGDLRSGEVLTRPVKGTRPASVAPEVLLRSEKDTAELTMIIDLMRNDLGRVCRIGSVRVCEPRHVESHPTVHHGVAGVCGRLRPDVTFGALLEATFPPGSVTGAPKIRAMQVIEALEPMPRGPYCGAIGFVSDHGRFAFNVAIRTLSLAGGADAACEVTYGTGCGIVADSDDGEELKESEDKAAVLRRLVTPREVAPGPARTIRP